MTSRISRALRGSCVAIAVLVLASGPQGAVIAHDAIHLISGHEHEHAHDRHAFRHFHTPKHAHKIIVQPSQPLLVQAVPHADEATTAVVTVTLVHADEPEPLAEDLRRTHDPPYRALPSAFPPALAAAPPAA